MYCGKCGALNPNDNLFCAACGSSIKPAVQTVASGPLAAAVAPALEQAPLRPAPAKIPVTVDPLKGVRGWLLLFCVGLVVVQPLSLLFEALNSGDAFVAGFNFLLGAITIYTGIALWCVAINALRLVKVYFVVVLTVATLVVASVILTASATRVTQTPSQDNSLTVGFRMLIGVAIWWSYFKKSKRVKATYGANL